MLPQTPSNSIILSHSIHINPNFKRNQSQATTIKTHINPNFLISRSKSVIHLNPEFLQRKLLEHQKQVIEHQQLIEVQQRPVVLQAPLTESVAPVVPAENTTKYKFISKSRMSLVREPAPVLANTSTSPTSNNPLIKLGKCKLLRRSLLDHTASHAVQVGVPMQKAIASPQGSGRGRYKLDRRKLVAATYALPLEKIRRRGFVGRYALRRTRDAGSRRKLNSSYIRPKASLLKSVGPNKTLQLLNISGVLYKSTRTKLQRKDTLTAISSQMSSAVNIKSASLKRYKASACMLRVRGTRYLLDKQGFKLTRVPDATTSTRLTSTRQPNSLRRIDIGGITYVATSQNVLIRTGNHLARSYLNTAKQRSLQVLTRNLVKSNVPCAIFQRVGKCSAFERGRCRKVHDRRQVAICNRFLRGNCENPNCLLSHDVSLAKMPVCKFFLQGICVRSDCPYLHKKVGRNVEVCTDFLRGYCQLAEQCKKRHEFICPDYERNGKCEKVSCVYCKKKAQIHKVVTSQMERKQEEKPTEGDLATSTDQDQESGAATVRYFIAGCNEDQRKQETGDTITDDTDADSKPCISRPRRKLGALPSYIPLC